MHFSNVLIPVRCFTCGNLIADKFDDYQYRVKSGENPCQVLDELCLAKYCCRRMLMTSVETLKQITPFYESMYKRNQEIQNELE